MDPIQFWSVLENGPRFQPKATPLASQECLDQLGSLQAPQILVDEAMKQVRELHGAQRNPIPDPYVTYFKDWSKDPFGGGYHDWKANIPVQDVMRIMRRPLAHEDIHICGEAYSDQQGWVEGAFCEAEKMVQQYFHLQWPSWLSKEYYLGW
jgi:hypothetical protein